MAGDSDSHEEKTSSKTKKDPADWVTKDEPSTDAQRSYLRTLATEAPTPLNRPSFGRTHLMSV
jgi:hypothetical protein